MKAVLAAVLIGYGISMILGRKRRNSRSGSGEASGCGRK